MLNKGMWLAAAGSAMLVPTSHAFAQDEPRAESTDIVVTARKRQESILKVPVVANVISEATLQQANIVDIKSVATKVPGLSVSPGISTIGTLISLRGVGTSAIDAGVDQSISLNIDGQQFSQGLAFSSGLFDLAQAEVLKGPQALFFGKNSPGGVISLTTADPKDYVEVIGRASYEFEAKEPRFEAILSGPVSNTLGLRLAGSWSDREGFFKNTAGATARPDLGGLAPSKVRSDSNKNWIVRGTAVWQPSTEFKARLKVNVTRDESDAPNPLQYSSCPSGTGPSVLSVPFIAGPNACRLDREVELVGMEPSAFPGVRNGGEPFTKIRQHFGVLDLSYAITPGINASSTTTYYKNETDTLINGTYSGASVAIYADNVFSRRDFSQEIRIESDNQASPLNWLVGGYYQDARMKITTFIGWNQKLNPFIQPIFGFGFPPILAGAKHDVKIESKSLFGQLRWKPADTLEIAGGVRWTSEQRSNDPSAYNNITGAYIPISQPPISSKNWSPELTITYTPTDDLTFFGALKQGYKSGSYSILSIPAVGSKGYGDEKVRGGEIGLKSRLLDRALNINAAFYYYKYSGLQIGVSQPAGGNNVPIVQTLNAGSARTYGIDFDATYRPPTFDGLTLNLAANWNKAKFVELTNLPCYGGQTIAAGCDQQLNPLTGLNTARDESGTPLERAPEWQIIGGFDYETSLTENLGLALGSSAQHSSSYKTPIGSRADFTQPSYTKLNAYITLKGKDNSWEVSLIGNNLNNVIRCGYCANSDFKNTTLLTALAQTTGGVNNVGPLGTSHIDEVGGIAIPGRQIVVKLTLRPIGLFQ